MSVHDDVMAQVQAALPASVKVHDTEVRVVDGRIQDAIPYVVYRGGDGDTVAHRLTGRSNRREHNLSFVCVGLSGRAVRDMAAAVRSALEGRRVQGGLVRFRPGQRDPETDPDARTTSDRQVSSLRVDFSLVI